MDEYFFGLGKGRVSDTERKRLDKIAEKHGAWFCPYRDPAEGPRYWFACPNRGEPFNGQTARAVMTEVGEIKTTKR